MQKTLFITIAFLFILLRSNAQQNLVPNGGFEEGYHVPQCNCHYSGGPGCGNGNQHPDDFNDDIQYWKQAYPNPDCWPQNYCPSADWQDVNLCLETCYRLNDRGFSNFPSNRYISAMGLDDIDDNEGVRVGLIKNGESYKLIPGMRYRFRVKLLKRSPTSRLILDFTKWAEHWKSTASGNERWLSVVEIDLSGSEFLNCVWYSFEREFTARSDMSELGNMILRSHEGWIEIDDVELYEYGCDNDLYIENKIYTWKEAPYKGQHIYAGYDVGAQTTNGNVIVQNNPGMEGYADITYRAEVQVHLLPGFSVESGANFHAHIAPCECATPLADAGPDWTICGQTPFQISAHTETFTNYTWSAEPPEGLAYLSDPNIHNPIFTPPPSGIGTVVFTLTVTNACNDAPDYDEVVISYVSVPDPTPPNISLSNIDDGDYISFDMNFTSNTEIITVEVLDWNGNPLDPAIFYTYSVGTDFTCCTMPWEIPYYLTTCENYKIRVRSRNYCSDVYDTEIFDWIRTNEPVSLNFINNWMSPGCGEGNDVLHIEYTSAETFELYINRGDNGAEIYHNSGTLPPQGEADIWWGNCNSSCGAWGDGIDGYKTYVLYLSSPCQSTQDYSGMVYTLFCNSGKTDETNTTNIINQKQGLQSNDKLLTSESIKIIPNPNNGIFTVQITSFDAESIVVQNMLGHTVYQIQNSSAKNVEIDLRDFSVGVYVVKVQTPSGQVFVEKVVYK